MGVMARKICLCLTISFLVFGLARGQGGSGYNPGDGGRPGGNGNHGGSGYNPGNGGNYGMVVQTTTAIMVGPVIILAGEVITMVVDLITMVATTLADLTIIMAIMGAQATTLEVAEVVLITTGTMVGQGTTLVATATMEVVGLITTGTMEGQGTTLAATATMEVVGLITTGTTTEVLDTTPADLITMDLRPTGRWWVRLLELLQLWW